MPLGVSCKFKWLKKWFLFREMQSPNEKIRRKKTYHIFGSSITTLYVYPCLNLSVRIHMVLWTKLWLNVQNKNNHGSHKKTPYIHNNTHVTFPQSKESKSCKTFKTKHSTLLLSFHLHSLSYHKPRTTIEVFKASPFGFNTKMETSSNSTNSSLFQLLGLIEGYDQPSASTLPRVITLFASVLGKMIQKNEKPFHTRRNKFSFFVKMQNWDFSILSDISCLNLPCDQQGRRDHYVPWLKSTVHEHPTLHRESPQVRSV